MICWNLQRSVRYLSDLVRYPRLLNTCCYRSLAYYTHHMTYSPSGAVPYTGLDGTREVMSDGGRGSGPRTVRERPPARGLPTRAGREGADRRQAHVREVRREGPVRVLRRQGDGRAGAARPRQERA